MNKTKTEMAPPQLADPQSSSSSSSLTNNDSPLLGKETMTLRKDDALPPAQPQVPSQQPSSCTCASSSCATSASSNRNNKLPSFSSPPSTGGYTRGNLELLNLLQHPVWIFDVERTCMFWANTAALRLWNADSLPELLGRDYATDMTHATRQRIQGLLQQLQNGQVIQEQWTYYPRGKPQTVNVTASLVWIMDENETNPRPAILDEAEICHEEYQAAATRDIELLRHVPVAVSQFDVAGDLLYQNPADIDTFGVANTTTSATTNTSTSTTTTTTSGHKEEQEAENNQNNAANECRDTNAFVDRFVDRTLGQSVLQRVTQGQEVNVQAEQYVVTTSSSSLSKTTTNRTTRHFAVSVRRTKDPSSSSSSNNNNNKQKSHSFVILYTARDVTEIVQARKEQDKVKLKAEFLSVIAHELRTPLHQVVGYADMLEMTDLDNRQLESVKLIQQSTESLMVIINDLLEYNRIESGKLSIERIHFCLGNVLEGCVAAMEAEAAVRNLYLRTQFDVDLPTIMVRGDPNRTRQIMLNLLQNAIKFTEQGGITFTASVIATPHGQHHKDTSKDGDDKETNTTMRILFQVIDTGIGIEPEHQKVIFTKFQQANSSISRKFGGTGLGLSICRSLSEAMGGSIDLESTPGKGTTFSVVIPFEVPSATTAVDATSLSHSPSLCNFGTMNTTGRPSGSHTDDHLPVLTRTLRILVVEDNKVNQKMVRRLLEKLGHSVQVAENGQVALDVLQQSMGRQDSDDITPVAGDGGCTVVKPRIPDLVLMDVQMPVMDGIEATRQVRHLLQLSKTDLPVVGLTASFQTTDLQMYLDVGMNTCLSKPIRLESLKRTLNSFAQPAEAA